MSKEEFLSMYPQRFYGPAEAQALVDRWFVNTGDGEVALGSLSMTSSFGFGARLSVRRSDCVSGFFHQMSMMEQFPDNFPIQDSLAEKYLAQYNTTLQQAQAQGRFGLPLSAVAC